MDLAELRFVVKTEQLEDAITKVAELGTAVSKLNKPMQDLTSNTKKVSSATDTATKSTDSKTKADEKAATTTSKLDTLLSKLSNRYTDMSKGSTSAEASVLQLARSLGATTETALEPYKEILKDIRGLSSNPFDSAIGSIRSIQQEYDGMAYRAELAAKGIFLTTSQLKEYSRIANEIKGQLKSLNLDPTKGEGLTKFNSELKKQQDEYLGIANSVNTLKAAEKERNDLLSSQMKESAKLQEASDNLFKNNLLRHKQDQDGYKQDMLEMRKYYADLEKQSKQSPQAAAVQMDAAVIAYRKNQAKITEDAAKANAYLAKEIERVNRLNAESDTITSTTNNRLIRFEKELRASGASAADAAIKLEAYKKSLIATQKAAKDGQIDYLSRALGPQITDIAVGLATGQAPLTILLQQGGQLRDQFALAGVAGKEMGDMLIKATSSMVTSVKDVGVAIGSAIVGAFINSGKAVTDFGMQITGTNFLLDGLRTKLISVVGENNKLVQSMDKVGRAFPAIVGTGIFSAIAIVTALLVEYSKVITAEKELTKSLALSGAALGMSRDSAIEYAKSMNGAGIGTRQAMKIIGEFANTGAEASIPLEEIIESAVDMQKYVGIASKDTTKAFADIAEKPVEGLIKLAKSTGNVTAMTILQAEAFVKAGDDAAAAKLAQESLRDSNKEVARSMKNNLDPLQTLWLDIKSGVSGVGQAIYDLLKSDTTIAIFRTVWETIAVIVTEVWYAIKQTGNEIGGIFAQLAAVMSGDFAGAANIGKMMKSDAAVARAEQDKLVASIMNRNNAEKETLKVTEDQAAANRKGAKAIEDRIKAEKSAATKPKSDVDRSQKEFEDELNRARKFYDDQVAAVENLTKSERALREARKSKGYKAGSPEGKKEIEQFYERADAEERLVQAEKDAANAIELKNKLLGQSENLGAEYYKTIDLINKYAKEGRFGAHEVLQLKAALEATTPEAKRLAAAQAENAKIMSGIAAERGAISEQYTGDFKTSDEKAAIKNLSDYRKKTAEADAELNKQLSAATEQTTYSEYQMYVEQAEAKKALAEDVYNREQYLLSDGFKNSKAQSDAMISLFKGMGDAIVDYALTGETSFGDMTEAIIADLIRMQVQMQMMNILQSAGGSSGIVSAITSMFTGGPEQLSGPGTPVPFAKGGTFTNSIVDSPTMFKFAKGTGLMGEAGPEAIMPLRRGSDGSLGVAASGGSSGGNVSVQVINNSSSQATTNETVDSKGNRKIEVVIGDMTAGEISRSGSASQRSIKSTFGLQPQLIRR